MPGLFKFFAVSILSLTACTAAYAAGGLQNVALGKPIAPITNSQLGSPAWVTDGNITEAWYSYQGGGYNQNSFTIDLGAQYAVDSVNMFIAQVYGYELYSSDNGVDWTLRSAVNFGGSFGGPLAPLAGGYSARHFRYWAYANWNQYVGVVEFQVCTLSDTPGTTCTLASNYTVAGIASGLTGGDTLVLKNNGTDDLSVTADGSFTFGTALPDGSTYAVTVATAPVGKTCSVTNDTGTIASANVTDVSVSCTAIPTHAIGGNVDGLTAGDTLVLKNNGIDDLNVTANGSFTFGTALTSGSTYAVTVATPPVGKTCSVTNGTGTIASANVTNVRVTCMAIVPVVPQGIPTLSEWGAMLLSGLMAMSGLLLQRRRPDSPR